MGRKGKERKEGEKQKTGNYLLLLLYYYITINILLNAFNSASELNIGYKFLI